MYSSPSVLRSKPRPPSEKTESGSGGEAAAASSLCTQDSARASLCTLLSSILAGLRLILTSSANCDSKAPPALLYLTQISFGHQVQDLTHPQPVLGPHLLRLHSRSTLKVFKVKKSEDSTEEQYGRYKNNYHLFS